MADPGVRGFGNDHCGQCADHVFVPRFWIVVEARRFPADECANGLEEKTGVEGITAGGPDSSPFLQRLDAQGHVIRQKTGPENGNGVTA